jgi:hypothetical protein
MQQKFRWLVVFFSLTLNADQFSFSFYNDAFAGTDKHFTNGISLSWLDETYRVPNSENNTSSTYTKFKEEVLKIKDNNKTVSLALGSGGARGYAHIGVIETIENQGYKIESIAGSSMGALVGGLYAVGKLEEYKQWVLTLNYYDLYKLLNLSLVDGGLVDAEKVFDKIETMIGNVNIEDLPIKYRAIATDLNTQTTVIFEKGKLIDAIEHQLLFPLFLHLYMWMIKF